LQSLGLQVGALHKNEARDVRHGSVRARQMPAGEEATGVEGPAYDELPHLRVNTNNINKNSPTQTRAARSNATTCTTRRTLLCVP
jgi:hypothetical protein